MQTLFAVSVLLIAASAPGALAEETAELTFCHFGPKVNVTDQISGKGCESSAKVQVVMWECTSDEQVASTVGTLRKKAMEEGAAECARICREKGKECTSRFVQPSRCGLSTDKDDAIIMGKREGCRKDCKGQAFAYCSLLDAGFRTYDADRMREQSPNCYCRAK